MLDPHCIALLQGMHIISCPFSNAGFTRLSFLQIKNDKYKSNSNSQNKEFPGTVDET